MKAYQWAAIVVLITLCAIVLRAAIGSWMLIVLPILCAIAWWAAAEI